MKQGCAAPVETDLKAMTKRLPPSQPPDYKVATGDHRRTRALSPAAAAIRMGVRISRKAALFDKALSKKSHSARNAKQNPFSVEKATITQLAAKAAKDDRGPQIYYLLGKNITVVRLISRFLQFNFYPVTKGCELPSPRQATSQRDD